MSRIPGGLPGDGEILKLSPMVSADQIVTGAADRLPDVGGKQHTKLAHFYIVRISNKSQIFIYIF